MFQFPRFPPLFRVGHLSPDGVAPFGLHRIIGCQHLPCAFRRVATSFIGPWRLGIHRVLFFDYVSRHGPCLLMFRLRGARGDVRLSAVSSPRSQRRSRHFDSSRYPSRSTAVEPRGFEPRTSAVQRRRSPRLSYGPPISPAPDTSHPNRGGRAWTRTRDLGLIRAAL